MVSRAHGANLSAGKKLVGTDKLVLICLADCANDDGVCWPGVKHVSAWCHVSERTAWAALRRLCREGVVEMVQAGRQHYHAHYRLNLSHAVFAGLRVPSVAEVATLEDVRPAGTTTLPDGRPEEAASLAVPDSQNSSPDPQNLRPFLVLTSKTDTAGESPATGLAGDQVGDGEEPTAPPAPDSYAAELEIIKGHYPKRDGDLKWRLAGRHFVAARKRGEPFGVIIAGVKRYAAYCRAKGWVGTEFVKQAASFFGREQCWREEWKPAALTPRRGMRDENFGRDPVTRFVG